MTRERTGETSESLAGEKTCSCDVKSIRTTHVRAGIADNVLVVVIECYRTRSPSAIVCIII